MSNLTKNRVDFYSILASSIHDIKNSLTTIHESTMRLAAKEKNCNNYECIKLEFEANRMNNSLIQLLELYKIDSAKFSLELDEHSVHEILQEIKAQQQPLLQLNGINLIIACTDDLYCYCDYNHICTALNSILNNAQRYSNSQIRLSAFLDGEYVTFCIEDDGNGYPAQLLSIDYVNDIPSINSISGSTGLGLHFVSTIAQLHFTKKANGFITIDNKSCFNGARFRLFLP